MAVGSPLTASFRKALLGKHSHARLIELLFFGSDWGVPFLCKVRTEVKQHHPCFTASSTTLPMPYEELGARQGLGGRRQSRWLRTADGFAVNGFPREGLTAG